MRDIRSLLSTRIEIPSEDLLYRILEFVNDRCITSYDDGVLIVTESMEYDRQRGENTLASGQVVQALESRIKYGNL